MNIQRKRERSPDVIADRPLSSKKRPRGAAGPQLHFEGTPHALDCTVTHRSDAALGVAGATFGACALTVPPQGPAQSLPREVPAQRPEGGVYGVPVVCLDWDQVRGDFVWDGTYRNLGVDNTTLEHWCRLFRALAHSPWAHALYLDGEQVPDFRHSLEDVFSPAGATRYLLKVELEDAVLHCHLNAEHEMAFNYDAGDIDDEDTFLLLMNFLQLLHTATGKDAFLGDSRMSALYLCSEKTDHGPLRLL